MDIDKRAPATKLLWVDLEMTGLDPQRHRIIEIAAEVTDFNFKSVASYEAIILQPDDVLADSNEWTKKQFAVNGLADKIRTEGRPEADIISEFTAFVQTAFGGEPAVLAGNSIHQDRAFIRNWWPEVDALLHYRMFDVSSWKILMQTKYDVQFNKTETHRALGDIHESIAELEFYLHWFKDHAAEV
ncbi:MAG TPA: oligoribonuclease [Candidatus Saccharimonadales bacterium]|jgi:oligoribonuclease